MIPMEPSSFLVRAKSALPLLAEFFFVEGKKRMAPMGVGSFLVRVKFAWVIVLLRVPLRSMAVDSSGYSRH